jgi:hypothetical protein
MPYSVSHSPCFICFDGVLDVAIYCRFFVIASMGLAKDGAEMEEGTLEIGMGKS